MAAAGGHVLRAAAMRLLRFRWAGRCGGFGALVPLQPAASAACGAAAGLHGRAAPCCDASRRRQPCSPLLRWLQPGRQRRFQPLCGPDARGGRVGRCMRQPRRLCSTGLLQPGGSTAGGQSPAVAAAAAEGQHGGQRPGESQQLWQPPGAGGSWACHSFVGSLPFPRVTAAAVSCAACRWAPPCVHDAWYSTARAPISGLPYQAEPAALHPGPFPMPPSHLQPPPLPRRRRPPCRPRRWRWRRPRPPCCAHCQRCRPRRPPGRLSWRGRLTSLSSSCWSWSARAPSTAWPAAARRRTRLGRPRKGECQVLLAALRLEGRAW